MWTNVTSQCEIEQRILARNQHHLEQMDRERSDNPTTDDLERNHGVNDSVRSLLAGTYVTEHEVNIEMASWLEMMKKKDKEKTPGPLVGIIPREAFQDLFKVADEKTSSNSSFGMNYTIWKALASDDEVAEVQCVMLSMPFLFGFANPRWRKEIDVMLEKKKGVRLIHILRIIGLLEADFNCALKYFFSVEMMKQAESKGLSDEQWGSRRNRTSIDAGFNKLTAYENARVTRTTMAEISHDKKACYDMMEPSMSNVLAQKHNVSEEICKCVDESKDHLERHVKTGLGVSAGFYKEEKGGRRMGGEVQGTGDAPAKYIVQRSVALDTLAAVAPGLNIPSADGSRKIAHHSIAFVNDTDGHVSDGRTGREVEKAIVAKLQQQCSSWRRIVEITHGKLALHKTNWHLLLGEWKNGDWTMVKATNETIILEDGKGVLAVINFLRPDQPNVGLGFKLCMDGNQTHEFNAMKKSLTHLCGSIKSAYLTAEEALQALQQRLKPKVAYPLHLTSFSKKQSRKINRIIRDAILPPMHHNRNTKGAVVYRAHFGMDLDCPLGSWLPVPMHTWFPCYRTKDSLIYRDENTNELQVFAETPALRGTGFHVYSGTTQAIPLESHPIAAQRIGEKLWTHRPMRLGKTDKDRQPSPWTRSVRHLQQT
ncbi:hypothetical protein ACHAWF_003900 [Thalassiosira exigua]